jgi:hypothetical protein
MNQHTTQQAPNNTGPSEDQAEAITSERVPGPVIVVREHYEDDGAPD